MKNLSGLRINFQRMADLLGYDAVLSELGRYAGLFKRRIELGAFLDCIEPVAVMEGIECFGRISDTAIKVKIALDLLDDLTLIVADLVDVSSGDEKIALCTIESDSAIKSLNRT